MFPDVSIELVVFAGLILAVLMVAAQLQLFYIKKILEQIRDK